MRRRNWAGAIAVATTCALVGAASGIATSVAATTTPAKTTAAKAKAAKTRAATTAASTTKGPGRGHHGDGFSVHSVSVQLNQAGTAFVTVTRDEGTVTAISGNDITLHQGTTTVTYKDATITVPAGASVTRNDATAALTEIKVGDRVSISSSSEATTVRAADPTYAPTGGHDRGHGPDNDDPASSSSATG
jgi:hypothetical protein